MLSVNQSMAVSQAQDENCLLRSNRRRDSEGESDLGVSDEGNEDDEKAYTLAVIVNTDQTYADVLEFWRLHAESMKKVYAG